MKKLFAALLGIVVSLHANENSNNQQPVILKTGLYSHVNLNQPSYAAQVCASALYAQRFQEKKDGVTFKRNNGIVKNLSHILAEQQKIKPIQPIKMPTLTEKYADSFQAKVLKPLDVDLDKILVKMPKELVESQVDPSKEITLTGSFIDMGYDQNRELKDALNDYTGLRIITQNRTLGITSFGSTNTKIDTINKVIQLKIRNKDESYKNDIQEIVNLKNKTFESIKKLAQKAGIYSPHIPEHRALLDCIETEEKGKKIFVGIKATNQQFYNAFKKQHKALTQMLPDEKVKEKQYLNLSREFEAEYNKYIDPNAPMQPLTEAITYNLGELTTDEKAFINQAAQAYKTKTPKLIQAIEQKLDEVKEGNLDVRGITPAHSYILAHVAEHKQSPIASNNQSYVNTLFTGVMNFFGYK